MAEDTEMPAWRKKFLATRMTFESILFEKELVQPKREKLSTGLLVLGGIWLFYSLLLAQWALRRGYFFGGADADSFAAVLRYAAYLKNEGFWALVKPEFSSLTLNPPLYYLSYIPVFDYLTKDLNLALILVNSFFLLVLAVSIFLAVRKSRPNRAGWLGAAFALGMPFVLETARRPAPELALLALTAAVYACYINSDEFEHPKWTFAFAVCLGLGFFSHRFFFLYALPLLPFIMSGFANPYSRDSLFKGFFPAFVINLPWYLFFAAAAAAGFVPLWGAYNGFWHYFRLAVSAAGLPFFLLGISGLTWMYFSVFMPYEKKGVVAAWCWAPYLMLTWLVRGSSPELLYPALLPFAVALPVMTPHQARKYLLVFVLAMGAVNQSGLLRPVMLGSYPLAGLPLPPSADYRAPELVAQVNAAAPADGGLVGIYGGDSFLNEDSLRFDMVRKNPGLKFSDAPACPACAFVLLHKTPRYGALPSASEKTFLALKETSWFPGLFKKKLELELADTSKVEVYVKLPALTQYFEEGPLNVYNLVFGPLRIDEGTLTLKGFNPSSGTYASAEFFSPYGTAYGADVYGLTLSVTGLAAAGPQAAPFVPAGVTSVKVTSAKISAYAVEGYLAGRFPFLKDLTVSLDNTLQVSATARGRKLDAEFTITAPGGTALEARPSSFSLGPVSIPDFMLNLFKFRLDFSDNPYGIRIRNLKLANQLIELH